MMLDLTSALYLDARHPSAQLSGWPALTTGRPAALGTSPAERHAAARLAARIGCDSALLVRSALHGLADCLAVLAGLDTPVLTDRGLYPLSEWAAQWHRGRGGPVLPAPHYNPVGLRTLLRRSSRPPVVLADGWCPGCGRSLPLRDYLRAVEEAGGLLVLDDTQALGVLGAAPTAADPFGRGGGGTAQWSGVRSAALVVVSSAAKGLGVPTAVVAGRQEVVRRLRDASPSRMHSSPPSAADVVALRGALERDAAWGDGLRRGLAALVMRLRTRLRHLGIALVGGMFPVQSLPVVSHAVASGIYRRLLADGVRALPQRLRCRLGATVTLQLTTRHSTHDVDRVADALARAWHAEVPSAS